MRIDTVHQETQTIVELTLTNDKERNLTDEDLKIVAFNQHRLCWYEKGDGRAYLPRDGKPAGTNPGDKARVERQPGTHHVRVVFPDDLN